MIKLFNQQLRKKNLVNKLNNNFSQNGKQTKIFSHCINESNKVNW